LTLRIPCSVQFIMIMNVGMIDSYRWTVADAMKRARGRASSNSNLSNSNVVAGA
jgi:hypothetical protein